MMQIKKANKEDHILLSSITKKSKAFWGYSQEQIKLWDEDLNISADYILKNETYKLMLSKKIIGYYAYFELNHEIAKLDNLFILPKFIGKGYGKILMTDFLLKVKEHGFKKVRLDSDPHAESFYKKFDFIVVGQLETSIKNRFLPIMERVLKTQIQ